MWTSTGMFVRERLQAEITVHFAHCWASCKSSGDPGAEAHAFEAEISQILLLSEA